VIESFEVAQAEEAFAGCQFYVPLAADANLHLAKVGVPDRQVLAHVSEPSANLTIGVARLAIAQRFFNA
jgi:hypothetical protein